MSIKLTEARLRQIIREEVKRSVLRENPDRDSAAKSILGVDDKHYANLKNQAIELANLRQKGGVEVDLAQAAADSGIPEEKIKELAQSATRAVKDNYYGYSEEELKQLSRLAATAEHMGGIIKTDSGKKVQAKAYSYLSDNGKTAFVHLRFLDNKQNTVDRIVIVK